MNFDELKKTLNEFKDEIEKGVTSTEQYTAFKENLESLKKAAKKNPFFATLSEVIINPISKELDRAYKKFNEKNVASYEGFDLVKDPKAMEKVRAYLETLESSYASMDAAKFTTALQPLLKVVSDLDNIRAENSTEEKFSEDVRRRVVELKLAAERIHAAPVSPSTAVVFHYHQTPFNINHKDFATQYRAYMEDLAVNAAAKNVQQLLEAGQILQIISADLKQTQAHSDDDEKLLQEVSIQTPLLLKIVDRQIVLKSSALEHYHAHNGQNPPRENKSEKTVGRKSAKNVPVLAKKTTKKAVKKAVKKSVKKVENTKKVAKKSSVKPTKSQKGTLK